MSLARAGGFLSKHGDRRNGRVDVKHLPPPAALDKIPPPHDIDTENTFLGAITTDSADRVGEFTWLRPDQFYSGKNQAWWAAVLETHLSGKTVDYQTVGSYLKDIGKHTLFEPGEIVSIYHSSAPISRPEQYAQRIAMLAKLRDLGAVGQRVYARVFVDHADPADVFAEAERMVVDVVRTAPGIGLRRHGIEEIFAPLPPEPPWLCKGLRLVAGRVVLFAGAPDSAKTLGVQSLATAVAFGKMIWDGFSVAKHGPVVHLNWDQEIKPTYRRYQKLTRGFGIPFADVKRNLEVIDMRDTPLTFEDEAMFAELRAICRGAVLVVIDALTGALGEVDENSPSVGRLLQRIGSISEQTGCVILVIHHARKPPPMFIRKGKGAPPPRDADALNDIRGSNSIAGASGAVFFQETIKKSELYGLKMGRGGTNSKRALDPFALSLKDIADESGNAIDALRITYVPPEQLAAMTKREDKPTADSNDIFEQLVARVVELMKANPGASGTALHARAGKVTERRFFAALHDAERRGLAKSEKGPNRSQLWRAT